MKTRNWMMMMMMTAAAGMFAASAHAVSLGPAAVVSGAARLDNGSLVTIGQPLVGAMSGGGVTLSLGVLPAASVATNLPAAPWLGSAMHLSQGEFHFSFATQLGRNYVIQASTNLAPGSWVTLETRPGTGGVLPFTDNQVTNFPYRFYRVEAR